jgi:hypothetical protein
MIRVVRQVRVTVRQVPTQQMPQRSRILFLRTNLLEQDWDHVSFTEYTYTGI